MTTVEICNEILEQTKEICSNINEDDVNQLIDEIFNAKKIFVGAAGRSLLVMRSFAMRLMQFGFNSNVAGDTTCPAIGEGDLLIVGSSSGETKSILNYIEVAKKRNAKIAIFTSNPNSTAAKESNVVLKIKRVMDKKKIQSSGSTFEQSLLIISDAIVSKIYYTGKLTDLEIDQYIMIRHANLQ